MSIVTGEELRKVLGRVKQSVRAKANSASAPLYYVHNGKYIREEPNGEKFIQIIDQDGILKDFKID